MVLRAEGQKEIADILKSGVTTQKLSEEQALAVLIDAKLSKSSYNIVRERVQKVSIHHMTQSLQLKRSVILQINTSKFQKVIAKLTCKSF